MLKLVVQKLEIMRYQQRFMVNRESILNAVYMKKHEFFDTQRIATF